jgi:NADPH:quinone reductase-like Zn-dependent oxidoreductase
MKAVQIRAHGGVEVLEYGDAPDPRPDNGEALIRVRASAINHLDLWVRGGIPGVRFAFPHVLGSDIAGEVVAVGGGCNRIQPGMRVLLSPALSCRQCLACLEGRDNECREYRLFGAGTPGGNRELMTAPEYAVIPIPDSLEFESAAAAPLVFLTAYHMLFTRANLQPGEDVLVLSASSGVGQAAIQLAKFFHCRVITTAGTEEKMERARSLGADMVIHHYRQDIAQEVRKATDKKGVDVVVEHVGATTWTHSLQCLSPGGRLVTCGATTGYDVRLDLRYLFSKRFSVLGSYMGRLGELHRVLRWVFEGKLRPIIDRVFPLEEIQEAHSRLERKEQFGKIVLRI